jgi:hypothetical protein
MQGYREKYERFSIFAGFCFWVGKNLVSQDKRAGIRVELWFSEGRRPVGYSDYDVFLKSDRGSQVYRYKK